MDFLNENKSYSITIRFAHDGNDSITSELILKAIEDGSEIILDPNSEWFREAEKKRLLAATPSQPSTIPRLVTSLTKAEAAKLAEIQRTGEEVETGGEEEYAE